MAAMATTGFQSTNLALAVDEVNRMVRGGQRCGCCGWRRGPGLGRRLRVGGARGTRACVGVVGTGKQVGCRVPELACTLRPVPRCRCPQIKWRLSDEPVAADEDEELRDPAVRRGVKCTIFFGYTSNLISCGLREVIRFLVQHRMVRAGHAEGGGVGVRWRRGGALVPRAPTVAAEGGGTGCGVRDCVCVGVSRLPTLPSRLGACACWACVCGLSEGGRDRDDCRRHRRGLLQVPRTALHRRLPPGRRHAAQEGGGVHLSA
jgi:hypothetical protein